MIDSWQSKDADLKAKHYDLVCWTCGRDLTPDTAEWPRDYGGNPVIDGNDPQCLPCVEAQGDHDHDRKLNR